MLYANDMESKLTRLRALLLEAGGFAVAERPNVDDLGDYRPSLQAVRELGVRRLLRDKH